MFYMAVWRRPEITEICFMGIDRLRKVGTHKVEALAVISESSMINLCVKYGIDYVVHKNHPLGEKKNAGLRRALEKGFDYLIDIGSDDLLKNEFLNIYPWKGDVYGLRDLVVMNTEDGECKRLVKKHHFGAGRAFSRKAVEAAGKMWNDEQTKGLDNYSEMNLAKKGFLMARLDVTEPLVIDMKSEMNMNSFNSLDGHEYPLQYALRGLSEQEQTAIKCLVSNKTSELSISA